MQQDNNLIIVGGTGRNVGKTECVCQLIQQVSRSHAVYALKVSAVFPDEVGYHGDHGSSDAGCQLFEETRLDTQKDTSRMLRAGASRVFFLCCDDRGIKEKYLDFRAIVPDGGVVICESNSLAQYVRPGLNMMVQGAGVIKDRAVERLRQADVIIQSDGKSGFPGLSQIRYNVQHSWHLQP